MGVHGAHELLVHVLDPNRVVEENFVSISIETKDGEAYDGIVSGENRESLKLRNASGDIEIQKRNIATRRSTGRSIMPEGFEALGPEGLRDLLTFIASEEGRFRSIDLRPAFTADSTKGIYASRESVRESLHFRKFGVVKVGDVPFDIVHPGKSPNGNNLVVLKGRNGLTREFPQRVEAPVANLKASRLHILGNVAGWGYPGGGEGTPAARFTLTHADGETESFTLTNGVHVVDYINPSLECPGSKKVDGVVTDHQIRLLTRSVQGKAPITKIAIESFNNTVASTFAAITAELGEGGTATDVPVSAVRQAEGAASGSSGGLTGAGAAAGGLAGKFSKDDGVIGVAITGGDSSHDFKRWWGGADVALLNAMPGVKAAYTENLDDLLDAFQGMDVFYLAHNKAMPNTKVREGLFAYVGRGGGLLVSHAGNWLNWKDWPEYNRELVSGLTRGHDKFGEFEVVVVDTAHPVMQGVPERFKIQDELYNFIPDTAGPARHVLATAKSPTSGKEFPIVWVVKHDKARILCNTLGHDGKAHEHPAYQKMLQNSVRWLARKE